MESTDSSSNTGIMTTFRVHSFDFKGNPIRVYVDPEGYQWWDSMDVYLVLGLKPSVKLVQCLYDDSYTLRDDNDDIVNFLVSELNVLFLIQQSKIPDAHEFKFWVTCKILPHLYDLYPIQ